MWRSCGHTVPGFPGTGKLDAAREKFHSLARRTAAGLLPGLFAWNGREYRFIADMIGPSVVNHWVAPGNAMIWSMVTRVSAGGVRPLRWFARLPIQQAHKGRNRLSRPDCASWPLIIHAAYEVEIPTNVSSALRHFKFRVIATGMRPPVGAWDDHGNDVLSLIARRDR